VRSVAGGGWPLGWLAAVALVGLTAAGPANAAADYSRYHNHEELTKALRALAAAHPTHARLVSIGKTLQGRDIWAIEIASQKGTPPGERPALLIAGNLEGDRLIGSALALYIAEHLLSEYARDPEIAQRLERSTFYIVPRVNPDGAEMMFAPIKTGQKTNSVPFDADNDGRVDEDGCDDLNKDGFITVMRVKDPRGPYMIHPDDPRLMKKADPHRGESGGYSIYWEGTDNDNDGFIGEDGPGGADIDRNFQHQYPYYAPDAGRHPVSELESRALIDYALERRNIAVILTFGGSDNLIVPPNRRGELGPPAVLSLLDFADASIEGARKIGMFETGEAGFFPGRGGQRPPAAAAAATPRGGPPARRPATTVNAADMEYFRAVSDRYRELTGIRNVPVTRAPAGAFFEYGYYQFGVPSFSTPGWGLPASTEKPAPGGRPDTAAQLPGVEGGAAAPVAADLRVLRWMDAEKIDGFVEWTPFQHPTLGAVEIGGFKPYVISNPPASKMAELGAGHASFVMYLSSVFANVKVAKSEVVNHGGGIYRIRAEIENSGLLPTAAAQGVLSRGSRPLMVQLQVDPQDIIAGNEKTMYVPSLPGSGGRESFEWIIRGKPGSSVALKVVSQKGGRETVTLKLQ
jgi:hypothetical protein